MEPAVSRITTPFGFHSTASEVLRGVDLSGKRAIVTGGASGIGLETARALLHAGATVTLAVRRPAFAAAAAHELSAAHKTRVEVAELDLADLASVSGFASRWSGPLHILVNNAGVMAIPDLQRTSQGCEMQFATNFLGHFALTLGLHDALKNAGGARIVSLSSSAQLMSPVVFDDLHFRFRPYEPFAAYAQAKTACALMAVEVNKRWQHERIFANAVHPGAIATKLQQHTGGLKTPPERRKNPAQGAATSVLLAGSPLLERVGGRYFEDCNEAQVMESRPLDFTGVAPYAIDADNAARLWTIASRLVEARA